MLCQPGSLLEERCRKNNLPLHTVRMRNELDFIAAWKIARYCKKHGFTVFHAHTAHALSLGIMVKMLNAPITLFASRRVDFSTRKTAMSVWKYNNRHLKKIICISNEIKNVLINDGINADKLTTIYDGIDLKKFHHFNRDETVCTQWGIPQNHFIVGTVAALVGHKDYPNFLEAAKIVKDSNKNISFIAVGGGKDEHKLRQLAAKLELGNRFIFTGFKKMWGQFFGVLICSSPLRTKKGSGLLYLMPWHLPFPLSVQMPVACPKPCSTIIMVSSFLKKLQGISSRNFDDRNPAGSARKIFKICSTFRRKICYSCHG